MKANSILSLFFACGALAWSPLTYANLGNSELVNSVSSTSESGSSNIATQFASYEACKDLGNSPAACREATERGVRFTGDSSPLSDEEVQSEVSRQDVALNEGQMTVYRVCRSFNNPADICFDHAKGGGLVWGPLLPQQIDQLRGGRLQVSEAIKDCVRNHALRAGDQLGLEVSDQLFRMQNLGNPNSFAFRAIQHYYTLCTEGT